MFNKLTFIIPIGTDTTLKLKDTNNTIVHIIVDPTCTIKQIDSALYVKQNAESALIILTFDSEQDAADAHILLRDALEQLKTNLNLASHAGGFNIYTFNPPDTVTGTDKVITLTISVTTILSLYVNGVLLNNDNNINYTLLTLPSRIVWKGDAIYELETTDIITIHYI